MTSLYATSLSAKDDPYRLPLDFKPTHYDLAIKTDLEDLTIQGVVTISLEARIKTSRIVLNVSELQLGEAFIHLAGSNEQRGIISFSYDEDRQRVTYQLENAVPENAKVALRIPFSGKLGDNPKGHFRCSWTKDDKIKYYSATHFEPTAARKAFPCWDEPLFKATFAIKMISRTDTVNLSNMPAASEETIANGANISPDLAEIVSTLQGGGEWKITTFETTPLMSSYIVAFSNGHFEFLENSVIMPLSGKTIPLRIYATPDLIHQAQFALDVKTAVLPLYEKTFDVEYPLPKLDTLVAHDYQGAMENWGLIAGAKDALLLDPERSTQEAKMEVFFVQCHEVAHMWFGNITTMEWWDNLYLNEGFATLMGELIMADKVYPEWNVNSDFINVHLNRAMALDGKLSSHPIEVECSDANRINEIFDALSYSKAGAVLRMLSQYVGEEKFLEGVSRYLKAHLYGNSVTRDLWEGISAATGVDIAEFMDSWISEVGYPVLTVTEDATVIHVRQDRFLETGPADPKDNETIWNVPLVPVTTTASGEAFLDRTLVLREREASISFDTTKPFKLNADTSGLYRVIYTPERLAKIAAEAAKEHSIFSLADRTGLIQDAFALAKAGFATVSSALTLVDLWRNEKDYLVWQTMSGSVGGLASIFWENSEIVDKLQSFQGTLFVPLVEKLGYVYDNQESSDTTLLRTLAITQAAAAADDGVITELRSRFQRYLDSGNASEIPAELQRITFATAVKYGGRTEYDAIIKIFGKAGNPSEERAALAAMGAPQDADSIQKTISFMTTKARDQDLLPLFASLGSNPKARRISTKFFMDNFDSLYERLKEHFSLPHIIRHSMEIYASQDDYLAIESFFKGKDTSKFNQALAQALDSIRARSAFVERSTTDLLAWLDKADAPIDKAIKDSKRKRGSAVLAKDAASPLPQKAKLLPDAEIDTSQI